MATQAPPPPPPQPSSCLRPTCWDSTKLTPKYPPLSADVEADVVIVGAGVAGLATAMRLLKPPTDAASSPSSAAAAPSPPPPLSVVVLEARVRSGGMTGRSTAHVMQWVDDYYYKIESVHGKEGAAKVAKAQEFAADEVGARRRGHGHRRGCCGGSDGTDNNSIKRALLAGKVASWRDPETGEVVRRSALCTHMGCALSWNALDKTFDCGCHGSVFDGRGRVCSGPAVVDLEELPGGGGGSGR